MRYLRFARHGRALMGENSELTEDETVDEWMKEGLKEELRKEYFADTYGLDYVVDKLWSLYSVLRLQEDREEKGIMDPLIESSHFMIVGARGTGKTMIGSIIARLLCDYGIRGVEDEIFMQAREILQAFYTNNEAAIEKLIDRVEDNRTLIIENFQNIFLDLDYEEVKGRRICVCLDQILKRKKDTLSVVVTMDKEAQSFIQKIDADFFDNIYDVIELQPYSIESLLKIAEKIAYDKGLLLREIAEKSLFYKIDQNYRSDTFMNAISIRRYLDEAVKKMAERYYKMEEKKENALVELLPEDFEMNIEEESLDELLAELDNMTGLREVKKTVYEMVNSVRTNKHKREANANSSSELGTMHLIFTGNPGTGKTTVARMIGKIYQQLGVLPRGHHTVECTRSRLIGQYLGETAKLVQQRFLEAEGGVLFLDEAHAICRDDQDSFGQEAVDELTPQIENHRKDTMVILAGYPGDMDKFLEKNEGLRSRFHMRVRFEDYTVDEMISIFCCMVKKDGRELAPGTENSVKRLITVKSKIPDFGNARGVRNVYEEVLIKQSNRIQKMIEQEEKVGKELFDMICQEDIEAVLAEKLPGEKTLEELLEEMTIMPGLQQAKKVVYDQISGLQYLKIMKERNLPVKDNQGTMHMLFKGNAGTGKTTMARIIAQI